MSSKYLIIIPTFNESENIPSLIKSFCGPSTNISLLFIDDSSPDGTGDVIESFAKQYQNIQLIRRDGKQGVGSAHKEGLLWAKQNGWSQVITMDADGSHDPEEVLRVIGMKNKTSILIGSRWLHSESLLGWSWHRRVITHLGHFLTTRLLGLPHDSTNAFRYYRLDDIRTSEIASIRSPGYSFFFESLCIFRNAGIAISETPIRMPARTYGSSKMSLRDMVSGLLFLFYLSATLRPKIASPTRSPAPPTPSAEKAWDDYWSRSPGRCKFLYNAAAVFYRAFIIKPAVNYFLKKYFKSNGNVLHAGCGTGAVDLSIEDNFTLSGLDISKEALSLFTKIHKPGTATYHASIFDAPLPGSQYDGIFNLGVMEHFKEDEINVILKCFHASLNPGGRIILFWPPSYGIATTFLRLVHRLLRIMGSNLKLHPDEFTYANTRPQINSYLVPAGFTLIDFYFGFRDAYTHRIIVAEKCGR